jgi:hypothetical protein
MTQRIRLLSARVATVVAAVTLLGCSAELPTSPRAAPMGSSPLPAAGGGSGTSTADRITISDGGLSFTLDVSDREIVASNGVVISLTESETAVMSSAFAYVVEGNQIADYLAQYPSEDPYANCGMGGQCPELRAEQSFQARMTEIRSAQVSANRSGVRLRVGSRPNRPRVSDRKQVRPTASADPDVARFDRFSNLEVGPCWELWISIYDGTAAFRAVEAELNEALSNLALSPELTYENGRWKVGIGDWQQQYVTILVLQAELLQKKLSLDILASLYHANNCDQAPFGPPIGWDGNISGGMH